MRWGMRRSLERLDTALMARVARVGWDDYSLPLSGQRELVVTNRSRSFVSFLFVYHFLKGRPVRPMLGLGSGWYSDARHVACRPAGCEIPPPPVEVAGGVVVSRDPDLGAVGLSGEVRERWVGEADGSRIGSPTTKTARRSFSSKSAIASEAASAHRARGVPPCRRLRASRGSRTVQGKRRP